MGAELFLVSEAAPLGQEIGELHDLTAVGHQIFVSVAEVECEMLGRGAGFHTGGEPAHLHAVRAEHAFLHGPLAMGDGEFRRVLHEPFFGRMGRLGPVEGADAVGAGGHAEPAADARVVVDHHNAPSLW
jgi:hypothetical protein